MLRRREHGTPGNWALPHATAHGRPFSSQPGSSGNALYTHERGEGKHRKLTLSRPGAWSRHMAAAFMFPGQGSQAVGMGQALAENFAPARAVFNEVDAALGEKLTAVMWEGPAEKLTLTENAQPALMAVSVAVMRVLEAEAGVDIKRDAKFVAGHSLGEYSAVAAAGAFSITDAAKLLRIRGNAMQKAVPVGTGAMAALLGLELEAAAAVAAEAAQGEVCQAANDNGG